MTVFIKHCLTNNTMTSELFSTEFSRKEEYFYMLITTIELWSLLWFILFFMIIFIIIFKRISYIICLNGNGSILVQVNLNLIELIVIQNLAIFAWKGLLLFGSLNIMRVVMMILNIFDTTFSDKSLNWMPVLSQTK